MSLDDIDDVGYDDNILNRNHRMTEEEYEIWLANEYDKDYDELIGVDVGHDRDTDWGF